jgi:hypothetical protein
MGSRANTEIDRLLPGIRITVIVTEEWCPNNFPIHPVSVAWSMDIIVLPFLKENSIGERDF